MAGCGHDRLLATVERPDVHEVFDGVKRRKRLKNRLESACPRSPLRALWVVVFVHARFLVEQSTANYQ
jgi:hypothetical protein